MANPLPADDALSPPTALAHGPIQHAADGLAAGMPLPEAPALAPLSPGWSPFLRPSWKTGLLGQLLLLTLVMGGTAVLAICGWPGPPEPGRRMLLFAATICLAAGLLSQAVDFVALRRNAGGAGAMLMLAIRFGIPTLGGFWCRSVLSPAEQAVFFPAFVALYLLTITGETLLSVSLFRRIPPA